MLKNGWQVKPSFILPKGYSLHEDTTGVYLYTENELVANFTHFADPKKIEEIAFNHRDGLRGVAM